MNHSDLITLLKRGKLTVAEATAIAKERDRIGDAIHDQAVAEAKAIYRRPFTIKPGVAA